MKGTAIGLLTLALIANVGAISWDCMGTKPYQLQKDDSYEKGYFVCFTEKSDPIFYDCPDEDEYTFNEKTESCTLDLDGRTEPSCTAVGETFIDPSGDPCVDYWECDVSLSPTHTSCTSSDPDSRFNLLLQQCVPEKYWLCGNGIPDCNQVEHRNQRWSDIQDCGSFYQCIGKTLTKQNCPSGYYFNATAQSCLHNTREYCKVPEDWLPPLLVDLENMCKGNVGKFLPDPYYCKAYYYCISEDTPYWSPCDNNMYFDNGICTKNVPSTCICETIDWEALSPSKTTSLAHPDPSKYYFCQKGFVAVEESCPVGMVFNVREKLCSY
ncbi:unnamed protein product [Hermetia illucens]|uniref:Chitin-binding type-2 domain-containing protein n=1 Tax=Hermetia illucens TaxID=343691 RepID=A0A7R8UH91_HERIL|nr:uncharacterized protein LOC119649741 [Hermetia illucens]CAD7080544.1 unnamed protein product [Hermetia illucens]